MNYFEIYKVFIKKIIDFLERNKKYIPFSSFLSGI